MRVLIAGGSGYIGGRLAMYLDKIGCKMVLGVRDALIFSSPLPGAQIIELDWHNQKNLEETCQGIDVLIHAAGMNSNDCLNNPSDALKFNGMATRNLAQAAAESNVKKFIYLSTAHVYSETLTGKIDENTIPKNFHPYAASHLMGEEYVLKYGSHSNMQSIILRLSNCYGSPAMDNKNCWDLVVNNLCMQAIKNHHLVLKSDSMQKRDFISLSEVCRAIGYIIFSKSKLFDTGILNLGTGVSSTLLEMACLIQKRCFLLAGYYPTISSHTNGQKNEFIFDVKKINNLGVNVKTSRNLNEIDQLLEYCKNIPMERN